jgi:hypothetical protein
VRLRERLGRGLHSLRQLEAAANRAGPAESAPSCLAQPLEDALQRLLHDVAPFRDSPETASGGLVRKSGHGDAEHTVADAALCSGWRVVEREAAWAPRSFRLACDLEMHGADQICEGSLRELPGCEHAVGS